MKHLLPKYIHWWQNPEDSSWNPTMVENNRRARLRAGMIIIKDGTEILLGEEASEPGVFSIPGGAINKDETIEDAAVREVNEEVLLDVINPSYTGIVYTTKCDEVSDWVVEHVPEEEWWIDYKTFLVISEYAGEFEGKVAKTDLDKSMASTSKFYPIKEVVNTPSFKTAWKQALINYGYLNNNQDILLEAKSDIQQLVNWAGKAIADEFFEVREKLPSPYNDLYYWIKNSEPWILRRFLLGYKSKNKTQKDEKENGSKLIYTDSEYSIYEVFTCKAMQYYGKHTKWCIASVEDEVFGDFGGGDNFYFTAYITKYKLIDGKYLVIINTKTNEKWCFLPTALQMTAHIANSILFNERDNKIPVVDWNKNISDNVITFLLDFINKAKLNTYKVTYASLLGESLFMHPNEDIIYIDSSKIEQILANTGELDYNKIIYDYVNYYDVTTLMVDNFNSIKIADYDTLTAIACRNTKNIAIQNCSNLNVFHLIYKGINPKDCNFTIHNCETLNSFYTTVSAKNLQDITDEKTWQLLTTVKKKNGWHYIKGANTRSSFDLVDIMKANSYNEAREESLNITNLTEATRNQLVSQSRNAGQYKGDTTRGKNRFERKKYSKIASQVKSYNQIDMNQFFKQDILEVQIPVTGETNTYTVTIKLNGVLAEIARNIKSNQNKFEYRTVLQALTKIFNTTDVYIKCTCADFRFRYAHRAIINNYSVDGTDKDPGPGKGIANPKDDMGKGCKHILLVLNNQDWIMKVASVIHNYINYSEENMMKPFQQVIFPKLYGIKIEDAIDNNLVPEDTKLETEKHIIEVINDWAKNRGKFVKGSNINPVAGKKLAKEQEKNSTKLTESKINGPTELYFVSESSELDKIVLSPKVPKNFMTERGYEDGTTPRICLAPSIDKCLTALSQDLKNKEFYVYQPKKVDSTRLHKATVLEVPDSEITDEYWYLGELKLKKVSKIRIISPDREHKYLYGEDKEAALRSWNWEEIEDYE